MAAPLDAPMPPKLDLGAGYTMRVTALATSDGSAVAGVKVSNFGVVLNDLGGGIDTGTLAVGPYQLVPGPSG